MTLHAKGAPFEVVAAAVRDTVAEVEEVAGTPCAEDDQGEVRGLLLSFVLTNGELMLGHHGGKPLRYSTHKICCSERDSCPSFSESCEAPSDHGAPVNHMIFASEELHGENVWTPMEAGQIVGVDSRMRFHSWPRERTLAAGE